MYRKCWRLFLIPKTKTYMTVIISSWARTVGVRAWLVFLGGEGVGMHLSDKFV